jgi:multisubunit Na+/H+ antiporter MnhG subunit
MVRFRHAPLVRFCLAALIALALMLNGMSRVVAATGDDGVGNTVIIAGTVITLCQFGTDGDGKTKSHLGHSCDQCALRLAPLQPQADLIPGIIRFPQVLTLRPAPSTRTSCQLTRNAAWPRGPPAA